MRLYCAFVAVWGSLSSAYVKKFIPSLLPNNQWIRHDARLTKPMGGMIGGGLEDSQDDLFHLQQQFKLIEKEGSSGVTYAAFFAWDEIQQLLQDQLMSEKDVKAIWETVVGSSNDSANLDDFIRINRDIDSFLGAEYNENGVDMDEEMFSDLSNSLKIPVHDSVEQESNFEGSFEEEFSFSDEPGYDVWGPQFNPVKVFEPDFLQYLKFFFEDNKNSKGLLSYQSFADWEDVRYLLDQGEIDVTCLKDVWLEALAERDRLSTGSGEAALKGFGNSFSSKSPFNEAVDLDTFLRLNARLEIVLNEVDEAVNSLTEGQIEKYFRGEFEELANGGTLINFDMLMDWEDLVEMIEKGEISADRVKEIWDLIPKEPLPLKVPSGKGNSRKSINNDIEVEGITVEGFLAFNSALDYGSSANIEEDGVKEYDFFEETD